MITKFLAAFAAFVLAAACTTAPSETERRASDDETHGAIARLMEANDVKGLALAIVADGELAHVQTFGLRNLDKGLGLEPSTVMYGASLTKATFAYFVMQLVDDGVIDLDRPIADYLPKPLPEYDDYADLAGDERWKKLTFRILLSHTAGFSNFRFFDRYGDYDPEGKLAIYFEPGTRYAYSGEGIILAQRVLEWGLGLDVGAEMQRRIFDRFGMRHTSMTWRDDFRDNLANEYSASGEDLGHKARSKVRAAGSMDTTIVDWGMFLAAVVRGDGLSKAAKAEMISTQIRIRSKAQFPTLRDWETDEYDDIELGYGLGWGVFKSPYGRAFFKEGHDDGTANYALCIEREKACILLMSNSVRAEGIFKEVIETAFGDVNMPWAWEGYIPYDLETPAD
ncbi:MAG: serine hydrolase domain-containing protein [Parvularculaceae bacterium]